MEFSWKWGVLKHYLKWEVVPDQPVCWETQINYFFSAFFFISSPKIQRKKSKASVAMMKVLPNELENQQEFDGFTEWLQTFELYRGKQGVEEFEDEGRVVGKFKVNIEPVYLVSNTDT